jgi:hypothetical protein
MCVTSFYTLYQGKCIWNVTAHILRFVKDYSQENSGNIEDEYLTYQSRRMMAPVVLVAARNPFLPL